jgi:hypothetical protein
MDSRHGLRDPSIQIGTTRIAAIGAKTAPIGLQPRPERQTAE